MGEWELILTQVELLKFEDVLLAISAQDTRGDICEVLLIVREALTLSFTHVRVILQ